MPESICSVCDLESSVVGPLETVQTKVEINGNIRTVSQFVCMHCKSHLDVSDNTNQDG